MGSRAAAAGVAVEAAGVAAGLLEVGDRREARDPAGAPDLPGVADRAGAPDLPVVVAPDPVAAPGLAVAPGRVVVPDPMVAIVPVRGPVVAEIVHPPSANPAEGGAASATVVVSAVAARMSAARVVLVVEAGLAAQEVLAGAALVAREVSEVLVAEGALAVVLILEAQVAWAEEVVLEALEASVGEVVLAGRVASVAQVVLAADLRLAADRASPLCLLTDLTLEEEAASARIWARLALEPWVVRWAAAWRIEWAIAPRPVCQDWATIGLVLVPSVTGETVSTIV
jgi:hypothetical protein